MDKNWEGKYLPQNTRKEGILNDSSLSHVILNYLNKNEIKLGNPNL